MAPIRLLPSGWPFILLQPESSIYYFVSHLLSPPPSLRSLSPPRKKSVTGEDAQFSRVAVGFLRRFHCRPWTERSDWSGNSMGGKKGNGHVHIWSGRVRPHVIWAGNTWFSKLPLYPYILRFRSLPRIFVLICLSNFRIFIKIGMYFKYVVSKLVFAHWRERHSVHVAFSIDNIVVTQKYIYI